MAKVSDALRQRLLNQKKQMSTGIIIDNKAFEKGLFRVLPRGGDVPGVEYISMYCERIKKGSTSPRTFGLKCPVMDYFDSLKTADKDVREAAYNTVRTSREYWMAVLDREDMGTTESPNIRILRAKRTVNQAILDRMLDDDDGEDITDLVEGRDIRIKKEGQKLDTEWKVTILDAKPISDDEEFIAAVQAAAEAFDLTQKFFAVKWDELAEIYTQLTGEEMPESYRDQKPETPKGSGKTTATKPAATKAAPAKPAAAKPGPKKAAEPEPEVAETDDNGITFGVTRVKLVIDDQEVFGVVTLWDGDANAGAGAYDVITEVAEGEKPETYACALEDFEIVVEETTESAEDAPVDPEVEPEQAAEPEEVVTPPKRTIAKPAATKPAAAPVKPAPAKPAAAAPAKAASKLPVKPAVAAKPAASVGIKARLGAQKK